MKDSILKRMREAAGAIEQIRNKYKAEGAVMTPDDEAALRAATEDYLKAESDYRTLEVSERASKFLNDAVDRAIVGTGRARADEPEHVRMFRAYMRGDMAAGAQLRATQTRASHETGVGATGGILVPTEIRNELITPEDDQHWMRRISVVTPVTANVTIPRTTSQPTASWAGETETAPTTQMTLGAYNFEPKRLTAKTSLSRTLARMSALDVESIIRNRFGYAFEKGEDIAYMQGNGVRKPMGIFTASDSGLSTAADVETASAGTITADDVIGLHMSLKAGYRSRASWVASRAWVAAIAKLKDANNQYIWRIDGQIGNALINGTSGILLGCPIFESENAPSALTAGNYTAVIGDFRHYQIFDFMEMELLVLDGDPYASDNEFGYVAHKFVDANIDLEEAFKRQKVKS